MAEHRFTLSISDAVAEAVGPGFIEAVAAAKLAEAELLIEKQAAYGPNNIARPPHGITPQAALLVRINDKLQRLGNLLERDVTSPEGSEARADTWIDVANYGTIGRLVEDGGWPGLPATLPPNRPAGPSPKAERSLLLNRAMVGDIDLSLWD